MLETEPNIKIVNHLDPYESFVKMINAKVLFTSTSAFSQAAGLLSKHNVIGINGQINGFKNLIASIDKYNGQIIFNNS